MATYIKTLKEDNGDITYPQTKAGAVLLNNGSDLETELSQYVTAEDIASTSALTPPVQTNMIADGAVTSGKIANKAVTSDKIDWTKFKIPSPGEIVQSYSNVANADKSFTMPSRGFFSCKTSVGLGDYVYIYINGITVAGQYYFGGSSGSISQVYVIFPVGAGDTVRVTASGANSLAEGVQLLSVRWV